MFQYFYNKYCSKVVSLLKAFDEDFEDHLDKEAKRLDKVCNNYIQSHVPAIPISERHML